jgi:integrase
MKKASKTLKPATIHRRLGSLSGVFTHGQRKGLVTVNILSKAERDKAGIKIPRPEKKPPRYLSSNEEKALRDALTARDRKLRAARSRYIQHCEERGEKAPSAITGAFSDHLHPLVVLALNTGIRRGALLQLRWSDIQSGQVFVRQTTDKAGKGYNVSLSDDAKQVLRLWQKQTGGKGNDLVFTHQGQPIKSIKTSWGTLIKEAGIKDFRFHDLRHSFASKLVMGGIPLFTVSQLLGHSSLDMTMKYAHLSPDHMADALKVLNHE